MSKEPIEKLNKEIDWEWQVLDALIVPFDSKDWAEVMEGSV